MQVQKEYTIPGYMQKFQCTGAACEDTCCSLWEITIDKSTYEKYKQIPDKSIREDVNRNLMRNSRDNGAHASFIMNQKTGNCPMLCNGLCSIQAKLGEDFLSQTCSTYPRVLNKRNDSIEVSALLSCPEIARLVLFSKDSMNFSHATELPTPNLMVKNQGELSKTKTKCSFAIRDLAVEVLRDHQFSLQHRLIILGVLLDNAANPFVAGEYAETLTFLDEFRDELQINQELRNYDIFASDDQFQFQFLNNTLMHHLNEFLWNTRYNECLNEYLKGIQSNGSSLSESLSTYRKVRKEIYDPYYKQNEYHMENYLINHVYQTFVADALVDSNLFNFFLKLVADYSFIRLHLIGMAAYRQELTDDMVIKLIQSYTKNYKFSNKFSDAILKDMAAQNISYLGGMSLLIK
ncbi:flagellin lysine-N-methylase [Paenibacillus albidus]|uniref:flagellin lysine-N-methylase n=1 Tax=Paenibacillus albidus TaxID=2041023 RepID=UPI001BEC60E9|nr:flagellin lysine-N-methylase [Paenibacillus albidus]MBT2292291.1 flagellin lysine-N-methylase [Paenibacillus albidus]